MNGSGLIYAVIVGAWAAYLVPMWLRRQDELNEARPTERFSTAIRLLSGRAGMERRYAKELRERGAMEAGPPAADPDAETDMVDVRAFAMAMTRTDVRPPSGAGGQEGSPDRGERGEHEGPGSAAARRREPEKRPENRSAKRPEKRPAGKRQPSPAALEHARRSKVLARRRRTTTVLFLAFTLGAIVAAVGGLAFLWAPGVPAVLLSAYIAHLRAQERRRFAFTMDRQRAEAAAQRLRESRAPHASRAPRASAQEEPEPVETAPEPETAPELSPQAADRRALVEQTDHAEWLDQQRERERGPAQGSSWDPVPVPLPTYVTAPVAPRATNSLDLGAPDTWSSARSGPAANP
ncbi:gephyrin-like molybdotransferase receptor GlpR, partial [Streptomyces sp. GC420]|uniref:divisome protein SepX/GlpR n=1 Tax=Streptomyces sp. GC420 TaxID=2697568 RepID=UPI0014152EB7